MLSHSKIRRLLSGLIFLLLFQATYAMGALDWAEKSGTQTISICTVEGSRTITLNQANPGEQHSSHCHCDCSPCGAVSLAATLPQTLSQPAPALQSPTLYPPIATPGLASPYSLHPPSHAPPIAS